MLFHQTISEKIKAYYIALEVYKQRRTDMGYMHITHTKREVQLLTNIRLLQQIGNINLN